MKVKVVERTGIFFILVQHLLLINVLGEGPFVDISEKNFFGTKTLTNADQNVATKNEIFIGEEFFACNLNNSCDFVKTIAGGTDSSAVSWVKVREQMQSCQEIYKAGYTTSGTFEIKISGGKCIQVYCDMQTGGGGWMVLQRRVDASLSFNKDWTAYKNGFGDLGGNLWIGLENMHLLTSSGMNATLRIDLRHKNAPHVLAHAEYESFKIGSELSGYTLNFGRYYGNAGDALSSGLHNGRRFYTHDKDTAGQCAARNAGGWWFSACFDAFLNGPYPDIDPYYMTWYTLYGSSGNITFSEMKIRYN